MENRLVRADFFDRPGIQGLGCDYLVLLAACTVHPRASACGVTYWSASAAKAVGFEHSVAVSGLRVVADRGEIVFDEQTLETWPTDFFLVNQAVGGKNGLYDKGRQRGLSTTKSEEIKARYAAAAAADAARIPAHLLPGNLISRFGSSGDRLMVSDSATALALHCNPYLSPAGIGPMDIDLIALMTAQAPHAVAGAVQRMGDRRIIETAGDEYRIRRQLELPGKLTHAWKILAIVDAADAADSKLGEAVLADLCRSLRMTRRDLRKFCRKNTSPRTGIVALCTETASEGAKKPTGSPNKSRTSCTHNSMCTVVDITKVEREEENKGTPPAGDGLGAASPPTTLRLMLDGLLKNGARVKNANLPADKKRVERIWEFAAALGDEQVLDAVKGCDYPLAALRACEAAPGFLEAVRKHQNPVESALAASALDARAAGERSVQERANACPQAPRKGGLAGWKRAGGLVAA